MAVSGTGDTVAALYLLRAVKNSLDDSTIS
jgi:hypothetical protein